MKSGREDAEVTCSEADSSTTSSSNRKCPVADDGKARVTDNERC